MLSLAGFREVLATVLLILVVSIFVGTLWYTYTQYHSKQPNNRFLHRCSACAKEFTCRDKPPAPKIVNGTIATTTATTSTTSTETKAPKSVDSADAANSVESAEAAGESKVAGVVKMGGRRPTVLKGKGKGKEEEKKAVGKVALPPLIAQRRASNINGFARKTVHVGSFPLEVADASGKSSNCCSVMNGDKPEHFCSFPCYRALLKKIK